MSICGSYSNRRETPDASIEPLLPRTISTAGQVDVLNGLVNPPFRLVKRNQASHQSLGNMEIQRKNCVNELFTNDFFHILTSLENTKFFALLVSAFLMSYAFFALGYLWFAVVWQCDLGIEVFMDAFLFSIETQMTIGYGTFDPEFKTCRGAGFVVIVQSVIGMTMQGMLIGIMYTRASSATSRASTVLFSNKACIRNINGRTCFTFQVCEMRTTQLIECHMRCYLYKHSYANHNVDDYNETQKVGIFFEQYLMRLQHPDDSMGAPLHTAFPQICIHHIDSWSPLLPREYTNDACSQTEALYGKQKCGAEYRVLTSQEDVRMPQKRFSSLERDLNAMQHPVFPLPPQRESDFATGSQTGYGCSVCGEQFSTHELLLAHLRFSKSNEEKNGDQGHAALYESHLARKTRCEGPEFEASLREHMRKYWFEVVVILEGVEGSTSASLQAKHSYTMDDIEWDHSFVPCVRLTPDGGAEIDYQWFHQTAPVFS